jgi:hypothetical protein
MIRDTMSIIFASQGYEAVGADISTTAIEKAQEVNVDWNSRRWLLTPSSMLPYFLNSLEPKT